MRLRRDNVIDAAMALLDERGLDDLTTRRLADRLGVRVGALYWHVRDKRELLIALAERIVAEAHPAEPSPTEDWAEHMIDAAHRLRAAMLRHRDGARLVAAYAPAGPRTLRMAENGLRVMHASGVPLAAAAYAGDTIMSYVTGFVLQEQMTGDQPSTDEGTPLDQLAELPLLAEWIRTKPATKDVAFATGLSHIVTGIRAALFPERA